MEAGINLLQVQLNCLHLIVFNIHIHIGIEWLTGCFHIFSLINGKWNTRSSFGSAELPLLTAADATVLVEPCLKLFWGNAQ